MVHPVLAVDPFVNHTNEEHEEVSFQSYSMLALLKLMSYVLVYCRHLNLRQRDF